MADATLAPALRAADGGSLKTRLRRAMLASRLRAFALVAPLLAFIVVSFAIPIGMLLWQGVHDPSYADAMPRSAPLLVAWDGTSPPDEEMAAALVQDLIAAREARSIGQVATRVNRELSGTRSLFTSTARGADKLAPPFLAALEADDKDWSRIEVWQAMKVSAQSLTPAFLAAAVDRQITADGRVLLLPEDERIHVALFLRTALVAGAVTLFCLVLGYPVAWWLANLPLRTANLLMILVLLPFWTSLLVRTSAWIAMLQGQGVVNDLMVVSGLNQVVLAVLLVFADYRALGLSSACGADVANLLAGGAAAMAALVEQGGATLSACARALIETARAEGIDAALAAAEAMRAEGEIRGYGDERFPLIYNMTGTLVAMTHILLPFMILPLYSVMKTISPSHLRAAKSLGANDLTAFVRVYLPQTVPGIGAGGLLVFILAIGYYITPALVGGQDGQLISNFIAYHMQRSLNWSLAAALGGLLLAGVLALYWLYDRLVGLDNMKLG